jgi:ABC-2 type transport system ATP-binding protein
MSLLDRAHPGARCEDTRVSALHTSQLTKVYPPGITAVDHLDLEVQEGEIFGLLGPNGAGKSTTAGILTGRVVPTSGTATVAGIDVTKDTDLVKQVIGVVPQTNTLDRALTVRENLYHHGRYFGMGRRAAREAADRELHRFRLADRADATVFALSGGLAQRLMLARAVLHGPRILFLDEPTSGLDPQSRLALWDILRELHQSGQTILLTTHYMEEADALCGRVAIIDHGRLLALDTPEALKATHGSGTIVTIHVDGDEEQLAAALRGVAGVDDVSVAAPGDHTLRIHLRSRDGMIPAIVSTAERQGVGISDVSIATASLETVFIELTGRDLRE